MIVDKIEAYLKQETLTIDYALKYEVEKIAGFSFSRQFMDPYDEQPKTLRLSSAGKCARQLAYKYHGFDKEGKTMDGRARLIFWTGDLAENTIVSLAKLSGCVVTGTGLNQVTVSININGANIKGHPDGILVDNAEMYLIEIKSMSSYAFERFEAGEISDEYIAQVNCYMHALGLNKCVFVALNKENGILKECIIEYDKAIVEKSIKNLGAVLISAPDNLPARPEWAVPDAKGFITWKCLYCAYWGKCWPYAKQVLVGKSYKLKHKTSDEIQKEEEKMRGEAA